MLNIMPIFICSECAYKTREKRLIIAHLNKKLPCSNAILVVDKKMMDSINGDLSLLKNTTITASEYDTDEDTSYDTS